MSGPYGPQQGAPQGPGTPGGYPGQPGPQGQWGQQPGGFAPAGPPRAPADLGKILPLVAGGLGVLCFIMGFLPAVSSGPSVFNSGAGYLPALFGVAGLLAFAPRLPKAGEHAFLVAVLSVVLLIVTLITLINVGSAGIGLILLLVFGLLTAAAAIGAWLFGSGVLRSAPRGGAAPPAYAPQGYPPAAPQQGPGGYPQGGAYGPGAPAGYPPAQGGYQPGPTAPPTAAPQAHGSAAGSAEASGGYPRPADGPDDDGHPDVTQQVRF